ncbi:protein tipE-like isoform X3 [Hetaerina americana]|uniref:protein tipE-like isoform X3 n=1 Tax=Hetaerina americana TaxID=62018 RepID=UPI003A7F1993
MDMERQAIMGSEADLARDDGASSPEGGSVGGGSSTSGRRPVLPEALAEPLVPLAEKAKFYASLCLGTTAILSAFAFLFLIPFVVDPAISTILSDFEPEAITCITSRVTYAEGMRNCSWSSCREGCTTAALKCHQILVNYSRVPYDVYLRRLEEASSRKRRRRRRDAPSPQTLLFPSTSSPTTPPGGGDADSGGGGPELPPATERAPVPPTDHHPTPPKSRKRQPHPLGGKSVTALVEAPPQPKVEEVAAAAATSEESATVLSPSPAAGEEREEDDEEENLDGVEDSAWDVVDTKFYVNTEGCGYPPRVNCSVFAKKFMMPMDPDPDKPRIFPCYYSRTYPERVVAKYSAEENIKHLVLSLIVPNVLFVGSIAILSYWYCPGCCGRGRGDGVGSAVGSVACSPVMGSVSGGSLRRGSAKSLRGSSSTDRLPTKEEDIDEEDEDDEEY